MPPRKAPKLRKGLSCGSTLRGYEFELSPLEGAAFFFNGTVSGSSEAAQLPSSYLASVCGGLESVRVECDVDDAVAAPLDSCSYLGRLSSASRYSLVDSHHPAKGVRIRYHNGAPCATEGVLSTVEFAFLCDKELDGRGTLEAVTRPDGSGCAYVFEFRTQYACPKHVGPLPPGGSTLLVSASLAVTCLVLAYIVAMAVLRMGGRAVPPPQCLRCRSRSHPELLRRHRSGHSFRGRRTGSRLRLSEGPEANDDSSLREALLQSVRSELDVVGSSGRGSGGGGGGVER